LFSSLELQVAVTLSWLHIACANPKPRVTLVTVTHGKNGFGFNRSVQWVMWFGRFSCEP